MKGNMSIKKALSFVLVALVLMSSYAGNAFAGGCAGINFKRTGSFKLSTPLSSAVYIDMDNDGIKDLIGPQQSGYIAVYKGGANLTFAAPVITSTGINLNEGANLFELALADFNGDGKRDVIIQSPISPYSIKVYYNNGANGFVFGSGGTVTGPPGVNSAVVMAVADFNGDGRLDTLEREGSVDGEAFARLQNNDGTFGAASPVFFARDFKNLHVRDFNSDGRADLLFTGAGPSGSDYVVRILTSNGNGTFTESATGSVHPTIHSGEGIAMADLTGDGREELITGLFPDTSGVSYRITFIGNGGTFDGGLTVGLANFINGSAINNVRPIRYGPRVKVAKFDQNNSNDLMFESSGGGNIFALNQGSNLAFNYSKQRQVDTQNSFTAFDFSGDGKADLFSMNRWFLSGDYIHNIALMQQVCEQQGQTKFIDFDLDGISDIVFWNPADGRWYFYFENGQVNGTPLVQFGLGSLGDIPTPQDYDGDGRSDYAIFRASTGYWYIYYSKTGGVGIQPFGMSGDIPVPADYDGDQKADIGVFRPSTGSWYYLPSSAPGTFYAFNWGLNGDIPLPVDYDGDNKADIAVYRPSDTNWYVFNSSDNSYSIATIGVPNAKPVPDDFDRDGKADLAVFNPATGYWGIRTTHNLYGYQVGAANDIMLTRNSIAGPRPTAYNILQQRFFYSATDSVLFQHPGGARNASWILPLN